jgi:hypothetical protein
VVKRALAICGLVLLALAVRPVYLIGVGLGFWQPIHRPEDVSPRARYVSTLKSAAWFDCSIDRTRGVNPCHAWDDAGRLVAYGNYRLDGEDRAATEAELRPSVLVLYPGHPDRAWIYLFKDRTIQGRLLVPVDANGVPLERFEVRTGSSQ